MATHSSILTWEIPWREEPGRLWSMGLQKGWTRVSNRLSRWRSNCKVRYYGILEENIGGRSFVIHHSKFFWDPLLRTMKKKPKVRSQPTMCDPILLTRPAVLLRGREDGVGCCCRHSCCLEGVVFYQWKLLSCVWLFATPGTIQSMEFSRPEYWSG